MAFTYVQGSASHGSGANFITVTLPNPPAQGNLVCVGLAVITVGVTLVSVIDANNNAYVITPNSPSIFETGTGKAYLCYLNSVPANASKVIKATVSTTSALNMFVDEFSYGMLSASFSNDATGQSSSAVTSIITPSIIPVSNGSLVYSYAVSQSGITAPTAGATLGAWTGSGAPINNGDMSEYILNQGNSAVAVNYTQTSGRYSAMAMSFSPSNSSSSWLTVNNANSLRGLKH